MSDCDLIGSWRYERYVHTRPNYTPPQSLKGLLASKEPVFRRRYLPLLPTDRRAKVVEIGCGCGEFLFFLQREGFRNLRGVDLDDHQISIGRQLGIENIECGRAEDVLTSCQGAVDCVVAIDVLEHVPKPQVVKFLRQIHGSLRQGGRLVCQVPNLAAFYLPLFYMDFTHETPFTASSLSQVLLMAGFSNVEVRPAEPIVHGFKSGLRAFLWKALNLVCRFVAGVEAGPQGDLNSIFTSTIMAIAKY